MKCIIDGISFLQGIQKIKHVIPKNTTMQELQCIWVYIDGIKNVKLIGTDLCNWIHIKLVTKYIDVSDSVIFGIPIDNLNLPSSKSDVMIQYTEDSDRLSVFLDKTEFSLPCMIPGTFNLCFPIEPNVKKIKLMDIDLQWFTDAINKLQPFINSDESTDIDFTSIHIDVLNNIMFAMDSYHIGICSGIIGKFYEDSFISLPNTNVNILNKFLPSSCKHRNTFKLFTPSTLSDNIVHISHADKYLIVECPNFTYICRYLTYPKMQDHVTGLMHKWSDEYSMNYSFDAHIPQVLKILLKYKKLHIKDNVVELNISDQNIYFTYVLNGTEYTDNLYTNFNPGVSNICYDVKVQFDVKIKLNLDYLLDVSKNATSNTIYIEGIGSASPISLNYGDYLSFIAPII